MNTTNDESTGAVAVPVDRPVRSLVERLRDACRAGDGCKCTLNEAADEIERLRALLGGMDSHGRYWVENRGRIIDAMTAAGLQIMSSRERCWLAPIGGHQS